LAPARSATPSPLARCRASWSFWTSLLILAMRMGSLHHSRFSTRYGGRPAGPRRAWKCEERGDLSRHGWMHMAHDGPKKNQPPLYTGCFRFEKE
jgi:hypothetical protein